MEAMARNSWRVAIATGGIIAAICHVSRAKAATRVAIGGWLLLCAITSSGRAQGGHRPLENAPRVLIECLRSGDSLSSEVAQLLRQELQKRAPIERMDVLSTDWMNDLYFPQGPIQWSDVRDVGLVARADMVVDISATESPDRIQVVAKRLLHPTQSNDPVLMARVTGPTVQAVVDSLARRFMSDTLLNRPVTR